MLTLPLENRLAARERPDAKPVMFQAWRQLLFLHWTFPAEDIQRFLPPSLDVDLFDGQAWVGVVPFAMRDVHPRGLPKVHWLSNFLELNLRTYVVDKQGTPGVWFFSLDAQRWIAVKLARTWFHLPYFWSSMSMQSREDDWIDYRCHRIGHPKELECRYQYKPTGETFTAKPGSLEFFLAERYFLFTTVPRRGLMKGQVHHVPYPLQPVEVSHYDENLFQLAGLSPTGRIFDHALYSPGVSVDVFALTPSNQGTSACSA